MANAAVLKVIVPVQDVPEGARVTKRTGSYPYVVRDKLEVFDGKGNRQPITSQGCRYLINQENGNANAIANDIEVVWHVESFELPDLMENLGYEED